MSTPREQPHRRSDYRHFHRIATRWMDNDAYGHVNNVAYLSWFDTVVNEFLIRSDALDPQRGDVIGFVVETQCRYLAPLSFPQPVDAALRVAKIGTSSVRYDVAIFAEDDDSARAQGHYVHVYVDRVNRKPAALPTVLRAALQKIAA